MNTEQTSKNIFTLVFNLGWKHVQVLLPKYERQNKDHKKTKANR